MIPEVEPHKPLTHVYFFWGETCNKCHQLRPHLEELIQVTYKDRNLVYIYIDAQDEFNQKWIVSAHNITSIPTVIFQNREGEDDESTITELERFIDIQPIDVYENKILYYT